MNRKSTREGDWRGVLYVATLVVAAVASSVLMGGARRGRVLAANGSGPPRLPGLKTEWVRNPLTGRRDECVAGEVLVRFGAATRGAARDAVHRAIGARVLSRIPEIGVERVGCPDGLSVEETVAAYRGRAGVISAEPNYIVRALERQKRVPAFDGAATLAGRSRLIPNDPRFAEQYGLGNIEAPAAWDTATGCPEVVIAVLDTGVNLTHEDLQANIWQNLDETPNNGVDDDGNGKVDDRFGWDFVDNDNDPDTEDNSGNGDKHGTHVAGIAAAIGNNGVGVAGVVWQCKIMSVRVLNASGNGTNAGVMDGIVYAAQNGAHVINLSIGGGYSAAMQSAIDFAYDRDVVICVALGNDGEEITTSQSTWQSPVCNDGTPGVDNKILGVAAVDRFDIKPGWSNYSAAYSFCDVSAPGVDVLSTWWPSGYGIISGTSMATPHVAGLAAMLRCQFPSDTNAEIMARIRGSADNIDAGNPAVAGKLGTGRINAFNALQPPQPGPIRFVSHDVDDDTQGTSDGDGDLLVEPGESIELSVTVRNQGMLQAQNVRATLTTTTPGITITDDSESFANVPAFATASTLDDFDFTVAPSVPLGSVINFELTAVADNGGPWVSQFSVRAGRGPDGEPDDTCPQAAPVPTNGTPVQRHFEVAGDHDWMRFQATQGTTYVIQTSELGGSSDRRSAGDAVNWKAAPGRAPLRRAFGAALSSKDVHALAVDTVMRLVDVGCGAQLAFDDDGGQGFASRIEWTAAAAGTYSVEVWDFKGSTGAYTFTISQLVPGPVEYAGHDIDDDPAGDSSGDGDGIIDAGERIELNVTVRNLGTAVTGVQGTLSTTTGGITVTRDTAAFGDLGFEAAATSAQPFVFSVDPELPSGTPIALALTISAAGAGPWVSQFQTVVGRDEFGEPDDSCQLAVEVPADGTVISRRFEVLGDHDWIKFQALAGVTYVIETGNLGSLAGKAPPEGPPKGRAQAALADTFLRLVDTDCVTTLATNDDISFPDNLASRIQWTPSVSGVYSAEVSCWADSCTGTYTISVTGVLSTISGTVRDVGGDGVQGVQVTAVLVGGSAAEDDAGARLADQKPHGGREVSWQTTTDSDGAYVIADLPAGGYTITPSHPNLAFSPMSRAATIPPAAVGMDFTATPWPGIQVDADPSTPGVVETQITTRTGAQVQVDVLATDVLDLDEYDFLLAFSPDKFVAVEATEGPFLGSLGGTTSFAADLSTPGQVHITNTLAGQNPAQAPDGSGVIARLTLQVLARGTCGALQPESATFTDSAGASRDPIPQSASVCGEVRGDYDGDHDVDVNDLALMRPHWGAIGGLQVGSRSCQPYDARFDENDDGRIDFADFLMIWRDNPTVHTRWIEGDVTGDEAVGGCGQRGYPAAAPDDWLDAWDLIAFAEHWQTSSGDPAWDPIFDFADQDGVAPADEPAVPVDGVVNVFDLLAFAANWHTGDGPASLSAVEAQAPRANAAAALQRGDAATEATARPTNEVVVAGDVVRAWLVAEEPTRLRAYDVAVAHDPSALALQSVEFGADAATVAAVILAEAKRPGPATTTNPAVGEGVIYLSDARTPGLVWLTAAASPSAGARGGLPDGVLAQLTFRALDVQRATAVRVKSLSMWGSDGTQTSAGGCVAPLRIVKMSERDWRAEIAVETNGLRKGGHYFGVLGALADATTSPPATSGAPRAPGGISWQDPRPSSARLRFHRGGNTARSDYRAAGSHRVRYVFDVETAEPGQEVTLLFPDLSDVPRRYRLLLRDVQAGRTVSLRTQSAYRYRTSLAGGKSSRRFVLDVVEQGSAPLTVTALAVVPKRSGAVSIEYNLSQPAAVSVEILNLAGVRVRTLEAGALKPSGRQATYWDGRSDAGTIAPRGTYLVRVRARGEPVASGGRGAGAASAVAAISIGR